MCAARCKSLGADCVEKPLKDQHKARAAPAAGCRRRQRRGRCRRVPPLRFGAQALSFPHRQRRIVLMTPQDRWIHTPPRKSATFDDHAIAEIRRAAATGIYDIRGGGAKRKLPHFDDLLFLGASISRYPLEGYREKCATDVTIGTRFAKKPITLKIPITIAGMSFGSLSAQAKEALGRGASAVGTSTTTGDGGMTPEERAAFQHPGLSGPAVALRHEPGRSAQGRRDRGRDRPGRQARRRRHAARPEDLQARRRDAHAAGGHRPALGLPASGLDRPRRSRDQDPGTARDHRLGEADLRQGRRVAALLRHGAGGEGRRRRGGARRHAGRHRGDAGRVHRERRHPDARARSARRCRRCRSSACTARCS